MTRNAFSCIAICAGFVTGCFPQSDLTGDLRPPATGRLTVTIEGLPGQVPAQVSITGPGGFGRTLTISETLVGLPPGAYRIAATEIPVGEDRYGATPTAQNVVVAAGLIPDSARVRYVPVTGRLHAPEDSVPAGTTAQMTITRAGRILQ